MSESRWRKAIERRFGALAVIGHRRPGRALALAAVLTVLGALFASRLSLNADLTALLPRSMPSAQNVEQLKERLGGIGYVVVVGTGAKPEALRRFADDLAPKLAAIEGIRYVDARRDAAFFRDHALYFLTLADLKALEQRLGARVGFEKRARNPLYVSLEDDEAPPSLDVSDLLEKYAGMSSRRLSGNGSDYFLDEREGLVALLAKPSGNSANMAFSQELLVRVNALLDGLDRTAYGPDFRLELTGTFQKKLDQQRQISADVALSSLVALALMLVYLTIHFRSLVAVALNLLPVGVGLAVTYGLVGAAYGEVNLLTGFLGAILGGLGVEHGIHLLGRYQGLRAGGESSEEATRDAFSHTGASALVSALVAALTFLSLAISEFKAFREFGVIAAIGMLVVVGAYLLTLPALLGVFARFGWLPRVREEGGRSVLARLLPKHSGAIGLALAVTFVGTLVALPQVRFDYDFAALEDGRLPSFVLDRKVNAILGYSQTPTVVLCDDVAQEEAVTIELEHRRAALGPASTIDFVASLAQLVPPDQQAKQHVLDSIGGLLDKVTPAMLAPQWRDAFSQLRQAVHTAPFVRDDLPRSLSRQFSGSRGPHSEFVLVFPRVRLSDGTKVLAFAEEVSALPGPRGTKVDAAGEAMILADIIRLVTREAPIILAAALISVLLAMWLTLGSLQEALLCLTPTVVSLLALVGLMPLALERFNYLNILVVPVLIGVTVDAGVHLVSRLREDDDFASVYVETGRAIVGGLITSAVGFGTLLLADHPGLNSVGRLANLGFAVNLVVTLLGFPALFLLLKARRARAKG